MRFVSLLFLNDGNIAISLMTIHLKSTAVHHAMLILNKPFLNYRPSNMLFCFFLFLIYVCFNENFVKNFMKKLSIFNTNFQNSCQDVVDYRILGLFWALTSFHFNVFKNRFHMLSQCLLPSITKKIVSYYWLVLGQQSFIVFQIHIFC